MKDRVEDKGYPEPLVSHEDVVAKPSLFWKTLGSLHTKMGTKLMVPIIGGVKLDLYTLYVEVTKRGGYDKVVAEKKWREMSSLFKFSPTTTSASYCLKKHYLSFLYHYEQVYFTKPYGSSLPPNDNAPMCFEAVGTIEGKFECGYLVSVKLGSETLHGVLYHPKQPNAVVDLAQSSNAIVPFDPEIEHLGRRNKKKRRGGGDPSHPKPNRSGYNFFFAQKHAELKSVMPYKEKVFTKMIAESWNNLDEEQKRVYQEYGVKDKERYQKELEEYNEKVTSEYTLASELSSYETC